MTTWAKRIEASLKAGKKPAYSDYEEGLEATLKELNETKAVLRDVSRKLGTIVMARMKGDTTGALAAIDDVIEKHVHIAHGNEGRMH